MKSLKRFLSAFGIFALLLGCDLSTKVVSEGGGDETHSTIDIQGVVLNGRSDPFAGVVVRLRGIALSDTTDSRGAYRLQASSAPRSGTGGAAVDTLDFWREGRIIHSELVPAWIATMPDVILVQRDISGRLLGDVGRVARVDAVFGDGGSDTIPLEWNTMLRAYSGFAYFEWTGELAKYEVRIEVRDSAGRLLGGSSSIPFTSRAGDLAIPAFDAGNAYPHVFMTGPDSAFAGDTVFVRVAAIDSFGRKVSWRTEGDHHWLPTGVWFVMPPGLDSVHPVPCVATNKDGLSTRDTFFVRKKFNRPEAKIVVSVLGDSIRVGFSASEPLHGQILEKRLILGRAKLMLVISSCCQAVPQTFDFRNGWSNVPPEDDSVVPSACLGFDSSFWEFVKRDSSLGVSGVDTLFEIPDPGMVQLKFEAKDDNGEIASAQSVRFRRIPTPVLEGVDLDGDSIVARWKDVDAYRVYDVDAEANSRWSYVWTVDGEAMRGSISVGSKLEAARIARPVAPGASVCFQVKETRAYGESLSAKVCTIETP